MPVIQRPGLHHTWLGTHPKLGSAQWTTTNTCSSNNRAIHLKARSSRLGEDHKAVQPLTGLLPSALLDDAAVLLADVFNPPKLHRTAAPSTAAAHNLLLHQMEPPPAKPRTRAGVKAKAAYESQLAVLRSSKHNGAWLATGAATVECMAAPQTAEAKKAAEKALWSAADAAVAAAAEAIQAQVPQQQLQVFSGSNGSCPFGSCVSRTRTGKWAAEVRVGKSAAESEWPASDGGVTAKPGKISRAYGSPLEAACAADLMRLAVLGAAVTESGKHNFALSLYTPAQVAALAAAVVSRYPELCQMVTGTSERDKELLTLLGAAAGAGSGSGDADSSSNTSTEIVLQAAVKKVVAAAAARVAALAAAEPEGQQQLQQQPQQQGPAPMASDYTGVSRYQAKSMSRPSWVCRIRLRPLGANTPEGELPQQMALYHDTPLEAACAYDLAHIVLRGPVGFNSTLNFHAGLYQESEINAMGALMRARYPTLLLAEDRPRWQQCHYLSATQQC